jgi:hypothetical protein
VNTIEVEASTVHTRESDVSFEKIGILKFEAFQFLRADESSHKAITIVSQQTYSDYSASVKALYHAM